jgi:hypothetical protein
VLALLRDPAFVDKSPAQVWARLLDDGIYLCSEPTMYRILRQAGEVHERRWQATHPSKVKPELVAHAHGQVYSWDITKLRGPQRGVWYDLYVIGEGQCDVESWRDVTLVAAGWRRTLGLVLAPRCHLVASALRVVPVAEP